jgi:hypothetical protein
VTVQLRRGEEAHAEELGRARFTDPDPVVASGSWALTAERVAQERGCAWYAVLTVDRLHGSVTRWRLAGSGSACWPR